MTGSELTAIRERIESMAHEDGRYVLACARTGERPIPTDRLRFPTRETAREAARATEQYRATLRGYDSRVPCYDVVVHELPEPTADAPGHTRCAPGSDWSLSEPVLTDWYVTRSR